jgi:hypothetical protein
LPGSLVQNKIWLLPVPKTLLGKPANIRIIKMKKALPKLIIALSLAILIAGCGSKNIVIEQAPHATAANEIAALARLTAIARAEMLYQTESGGGFATLDDLIQKGYANDPSKGKLTGYKLEVKVGSDGFQATATPEKFPITGKRSFYIDERNVMRGADKGGLPATAADPQV